MKVNLNTMANIFQQTIPGTIFSNGVVKGQIVIDSYDADGNYNPRIFEFTGKNAVEANKKLELNFMLRKKAITKSGAEDWQLTLEEEVSVL